ncbi:DUF1648 domain-containing protein [Streptococcus suis]|uniref:DUF1648 domain-containing protein n=1 Tax=Streptococcus suis TaxID=1307 RepID=UPI000CF57DDD|nr:DUF1648 domain-containing protein [Streptococcus suis]MBL6504192.1 DUF1648 domain-containing protein [Streptococcus suis]MBM7204971.1 DUF1648 domain-containing protein [Streptococcus suis]MBM7282199.1 DUF1648 domain-containing protein [Streptococcus suis]MBO4135716.1 DUF1648 domain-containing protein [Streptococcus suis]HEM6592013.1 DUF1648 domain-containing protein [Streptococcus suis]
MKKIDIKTLLATSSIFLLIAVLMICYYKALPDTMVTHFGVNGEPNGSMPKYMVTILAPLLFFCVHLFICVHYDVKGIGKTPDIRVVKWLFPLLALIIQVSLLWYNLGGELDYRRLVIGLLAVYYMVIGNYLPKEELDSKTNEIERRGRKHVGYFLIIGGLLQLVSLLGSPTLSILVMILVGISVVSLSIYYAYLHFKTAS